MATISSEELFDEVLNLPEDERARLVAALLASFDGPADPDAEEAWAREIERRVREIEEGRVTLEPWASVRDRLLARYRK